MDNNLYLELRIAHHLMDAKGSANTYPEKEKIKEVIKNCGYKAYNISIIYDELMRFWRFSADIITIEEEQKD